MSSDTTYEKHLRLFSALMTDVLNASAVAEAAEDFRTYMAIQETLKKVSDILTAAAEEAMIGSLTSDTRRARSDGLWDAVELVETYQTALFKERHGVRQ